eukprot:734775_1
MAHDVFGNKRQCEIPQQDILKCQAIRRIKIILHDFNNNPSQKDRHENESTLMNQFASIFVSNCYTNTSLLNDFHHIKYVHRADDNDEAFSKIHEYFIDGIDTVCDGNQCLLIGRYYRDRSILRILRNEAQDNDEHNPHDPQYMMDLISRIHVYFIHSYHINRFTMDELRSVNEQTEDSNLNGEALEDKKVQLLSDIMNTKHDIIGIKSDNDKFKEHMSIVKPKQETSVIDYAKMSNILHKRDITIAMQDLRSAFSAYTGDRNNNDKDMLIADVIDAYYDDTSLPLSNGISITSLGSDYAHRHTIYGIILFEYFEKRDINVANFVKLTEKLMAKYYPAIDLPAFVEAAMSANINGSIFIKGNAEHKSSLQFAKIFKSVKGYKKKKLTDLYKRINSSWDHIEIERKDDKIASNATEITREREECKQPKTTAQNKKQFEAELENVEMKDDDACDDVEIEIKQDEFESQDNSNLSTQQSERHDIYDTGNQFYYWHSYRHHPRYIEAKYCDLKEEMLNNPVRCLELSQWRSLQTECKTDIATDVARNIKSNGFWENMYKIAKFTLFSIHHLCALKVYTDYTTESKLFCATLRSGNPQKIGTIAVWCRLLVECVQCYGTELDSKKEKYYRGVDSEFIFEKIATRFHLPMSTSRNIYEAMRFVKTNGLILVLCKYDYGRGYTSSRHWSYIGIRCDDVLKFDCDKLSAFSHEKETLFFGGKTILKIFSLRQYVDNSWKDYKQYMKPMNIINRMIHGLGINIQDESQHNDVNELNRKMAFELMKRALCIFNADTSQMEVPLYIQKLWNHYTFNTTITLNLTQLTKDYKWMNPLFMKTNDRNDTDSQILLNVADICAIFNKADEIVFIMPKGHIISYDQCASLLEQDFASISMDVTIRFKWPVEMPRSNRDRIDQYALTTWSKLFAPDS